MFALRLWLVVSLCATGIDRTCADTADDLKRLFVEPPDAARPWVYWFWMDGNLSREGITADLEAMKRVGIGGVIIMEVDVGVPRGPVRFMSPEWRALFQHVAGEAARLGLEIDLNAGPGWTGSGGPWIRPDESMKKVVVSETIVEGPRPFEGVIPPPPAEHGFYRDIALLAFPAPGNDYRIRDIQEKALYSRGHVSSQRGVRTSIPAPAAHSVLAGDQVIAKQRIVDLTARLDSDGRLAWDVPEGRWTVLRFGSTSTGANTRPAPAPGLGLECDKMDKAALEAHFREFPGKLLRDIGPFAGRSLVSLHIDSWEMGPQNWTSKFRAEFQRLRGYDLVRYLPVLTGRVVESLAVSERFLWDLRQTVSELIHENYAAHLRVLARRHGLRLSIQPYDGTPCDDMTYCARADVPMCEFWANCFDTFFTATEATSVAHVYGRPVVAAEAFTSDANERWLLHPGAMKALGDWAFCQGVNRFVFHRYAHQPWLDRWPGMTMGPYGLHYERTQTWWEHVSAWHAYLSRCQFLLQRGLFVADICYLAPEGAPHVFRPPASATRGHPPDRLGYNFDGCTPEALLTRVSVKDGRLTLPDAMSYRLLVLPDVETMRPELLGKIKELVATGATVVGPRPRASPSLSGYPSCDEEVRTLAAELWGSGEAPPKLTERSFGKGRVIWGGAIGTRNEVGEETPRPLEAARWIWHEEGNPALRAPVGKRYFRRTLRLEEAAVIDDAQLVLTADNAFTVWVNGQLAGSGDNFTRLFVIDVAPFLKPGTNLVALAAENGGTGPNPAAVIGSLRVRCRDGTTIDVPTDRRWESAPTAGNGWNTDDTAAGEWGAALEIGRLGIAPWGVVDPPASQPDIYPEYGVVAGVLETMGVPPDFEADAPLRYTHRREAGVDLYFVANGDDAPFGGECAFRVSRRIPEIWDPMTGQIRKQLAYREEGSRMYVPLRLEPAGSVFVVFREEDPTARSTRESRPLVALSEDDANLLAAAISPSAGPPAAELLGRAGNDVRVLVWKNDGYDRKSASGTARRVAVSSLPAPLSVKGPWEVRFEPQRGAPEKVTFEELVDWSKHPDDGVKYFSGTATYFKAFEVPPAMVGKDRRLELDLGRVEVMARVKLNQKDLGVQWHAPFRVDVTEAVRPGVNALEISVVNLWPNRLIGDQALPPEKRVTWTTWNPFRKDSPLLESGLLGPVTLRAGVVVGIPVR